MSIFWMDNKDYPLKLVIIILRNDEKAIYENKIINEIFQKQRPELVYKVY